MANRVIRGLILCAFVAVAGFFLLTEHRAHVFGALPYLLLLACPLLHLLLHGRHGSHESDDRLGEKQDHPSGHTRGNSHG